MSIPYELFFHVREGHAPSEESILEYFADLSWCSRIGRDEQYGHWFSYENPATGVNCSFFFDHGCDQPADYTPEGYIYPGLYFRMSSIRPSFFAAEAMPLVVAFCRRFDLLVDNPQEETVGPPDEAQLIESWRKHNTAAILDLPRSQAADLTYVPEERAMAWWRHIYHGLELAVSSDQDLIMPELLWMHDDDGGIVTVALWQVGDPQLFPLSDYIWVQVQDHLELGLEDEVDGFIAYDDVITSLRPYLEEYRTPGGTIPALSATGSSQLGAILGRYDILPAETGDFEEIPINCMYDVDRE